MDKIYSLDQLKILIEANPHKWRPLVFTSGCFDLLHLGHLRYLAKAKKLGNSLIVGVNSDHSVQAIKPKDKNIITRPIIPEEQRAKMLSYIKIVDGIVIFSGTTPSDLIQILQPDIFTKGEIYNLDKLPETPFVKAYGGKIQLINSEISISTTKIIQRILDQ